MKPYHLLIIGAGPAGLSAAARAARYDAERGASEPGYLLLEAFDTAARTVFHYQKGKHVMAEPGFLRLRSDMPFAAGRREAVLQAWDEAAQALRLNIRYGCEVESLRGEGGDFSVRLTDGEALQAENIVLAIGTQGNPRQLGVPQDEESAFVSYKLDDAGAYRGEHIVVVGAGDAAIENAIALAEGNRVTIINRRAEFSRAKEGNLNAILSAINDPRTLLECSYESSIAGLELPAAPGEDGAIVLRTPAGKQRLSCRRIVARLGTVPPRRFVETCGIRIEDPRPEALPEVDRHYQSNIPGLYVIGALGGYPLIKQAMNQGYEVVDFIHGLETRPADYELLASQFAGLPYALDPEDVLGLYQSRVPMFRRMNPLAFRELIIESRVLYAEEGAATPGEIPARHTVCLPAGSALYEDGEYTSSFFTLVEGAVSLQLEADGPWQDIGPGQFFGEMSLISGRPRQGSAMVQRDSIVIETPRRIMVKLMSSNDDIREGIDRVFVLRALLSAFRCDLPLDELTAIASGIASRTLEAGETLFREGETGQELFLIRRGRIALSRGGKQRVINQLQSGELVGQLAVMGSPLRRETASAAVRTEVLAIGQDEFLRLAGHSGEHLRVLQKRAAESLRRGNTIASRDESAHTLEFLINRGMGEATSALLIDDSLCIGCDNCERACAETHDGISRLRRRSDEALNHWHIAGSCLHCELPHCMKDCPTDAIRRSADGEVFITEACIGCGNCETHCPYDAISLRYPAPPTSSLLSWLFFGAGRGPGDRGSAEPAGEDDAKVAVKCDACRDLRGGYACVNACPTGAAIRVGSEGLIDLVQRL